MLRFADQKMNVFGHHHITYDNEFIVPPDVFQQFEKEITSVSRAQ